MRRGVAAVALAGLAAFDAAAAGFEAQVRSPTGAPVEDAAVVLEPVSGRVPPPRGPVSIEQRDREFVPYLTIVQKGTAVSFPNRDKLKHHVYSFSPAKIFEIKLYAGQPARPVVFDKAGEIALGCNIHDWMEAHVLVVDSAWFARTGADGIARVAAVPAGSYRLRAWHPRQKAPAATQDVEIRDGPAHRAALTLDVTPRQPRPKPPIDTGGYAD